jgi:hypothetical protein
MSETRPSVREVRARGAHPESIPQPVSSGADLSGSPFTGKTVSHKKVRPEVDGQISAFEQSLEPKIAPEVVEVVEVVDRMPKTERAPWFRVGTKYYRQIPHTRTQYETWGAKLPFDMQVQLSSRSIKSDQTIKPEKGFGTVYVLGEVACVNDEDKFRWVDLNGKGKTVDNTTPSKF